MLAFFRIHAPNFQSRIDFEPFSLALGKFRKKTRIYRCIPISTIVYLTFPSFDSIASFFRLLWALQGPLSSVSNKTWLLRDQTFLQFKKNLSKEKYKIINSEIWTASREESDKTNNKQTNKQTDRQTDRQNKNTFKGVMLFFQWVEVKRRKRSIKVFVPM